MDIEGYRRRILSFPLEELHGLVEADPEAAVAWSEEEEKMASEYAAADNISLDETMKEQIWTAIQSTISCFQHSQG